MNPERLAERVYERLADDERLRGSLTDDGFAPLLDWAASYALAQAPHAARRGDVGAEWLAGRLRAALAAVVAAAEEPARAELAPLAALLDRSAAARVGDALAQGADPDHRAAAAAAVLAAAAPPR